VDKVGVGGFGWDWAGLGWVRMGGI